MEILLNAENIAAYTENIADDIAAKIKNKNDIAIIGIRSRGEILAKRLADLLNEKCSSQIPYGTLDITLYRDDINAPSSSQKIVRSTEINFNIDEKIVILVDDVLHTGRSTRAALDALVDLGRPKAIKLAVLIERSGREFPISSDFAGAKIDLPKNKSVQVNFTESDQTEQVVII